MDDVRVDGRNALGQGDGVTRGEVDVGRKNLNDDEKTLTLIKAWRMIKTKLNDDKNPAI